MNPTIIKVVKALSLTASILGMIGSAWAGGKENELTLNKLVEQKLQQ